MSGPTRTTTTTELSSPSARLAGASRLLIWRQVGQLAGAAAARRLLMTAPRANRVPRPTRLAIAESWRRRLFEARCCRRRRFCRVLFRRRLVSWPRSNFKSDGKLFPAIEADSLESLRRRPPVAGRVRMGIARLKRKWNWRWAKKSGLGKTKLRSSIAFRTPTPRASHDDDDDKECTLAFLSPPPRLWAVANGYHFCQPDRPTHRSLPLPLPLPIPIPLSTTRGR